MALNARLGAWSREINLFELRQRNRLLIAAGTAEQHDDAARTDRLHPAVMVAVVVRNDRAVGSRSHTKCAQQKTCVNESFRSNRSLSESGFSRVVEHLGLHRVFRKNRRFRKNPSAEADSCRTAPARRRSQQSCIAWGGWTG